MYRFSNNSYKKLKGVHPRLIRFFEELIAIADDDFSIVEGVRTTETQQMYYSWGRTVFEKPWGEKVVKPVTLLDGVIRKSKHQLQVDGYSHSVDIAFTGKTKEERYDPNKFKRLREKATPLMQKYGVFWGGDWVKFKDMPHWQLNN